MCLSYSKTATKELRRTKHETIIAYKVVCYSSYLNRLCSPIYGHMRWIRYWNISDRKSTRLLSIERNSSQVYHGIHVYLSKSEATKNRYVDRIAVIKIKCDPKDLVAVNEDKTQAVFTKVYLPRKEFDRARGKI